MKQPTFGPPADLGDLDPLKFTVLALEEAVRILHQQNKQQTILHLAAEYNCINLIKGYIRNSDINIKDQDSGEEKTPLHYAIEYHHIEVAEFLIKFGAYLHAGDWLGRTPIHYAARYAKNCQLVQVLIQEKAKWNTPDINGVTPLMLVSRPDIAEMIIEAGGDLNIRDKDGNTVLHHAASDYNLNMIEYWLQAGQNPRTLNRVEQTPWEYLLWSDQLTNISNHDKMEFIQAGEGEVYENIRQIQKLLNQ